VRQIGEFENSKLRGRIREKLGSEAELARRLNLNRSTISTRLSGKTQFTRSEIALIVRMLDIDKVDIGMYFFTEIEQCN